MSSVINTSTEFNAITENIFSFLVPIDDNTKNIISNICQARLSQAMELCQTTRSEAIEHDSRENSVQLVETATRTSQAAASLFGFSPSRVTHTGQEGSWRGRTFKVLSSTSKS